MRIHDVTAPLREDLPVWPGEEGLRRRLVKDQARGDSSTVSHLSLGAHTGTHIDAPVHFLEGGGGIDALPAEALVGPAVVAGLEGVQGRIAASDLEAAVPEGVERLLLKTRNSGWSKSDTSFREDFVALDPSAAEWCVARRVRLVGIDYLSIEPFGSGSRGHPVHRALLGAGVVIVEGLDLAAVEPGSYLVAALPLAVPGSDGAPARVVLVEDLA
ncbi:MAG TPA: cyclase family protein [Actinomycetota bacterium]|jgi:arylformamidase|nr:cyclase family protein [Actinomycetota bacterium]